MKPLFLVLFYWAFFFAASQNPQDAYANYARIGWGAGTTTYRDFATSPLFYSGWMGHYHMDHWVRKTTSEQLFAARFSGGQTAQSFNGVFNQATVFTLQTHYTFLYPLQFISNPRQRFLVGLMVESHGHLRLNPSLLNNQTGFEVLTNLSGSLAWRRDISRQKAYQLRIKGKGITLQPRRKEILWDLHGGFLNSALRNGFAYIYDDPAIEISSLYPSYRWFWGGMRLQSRLTYQWFKSNGNGYGLSYIWTAATTGGPYETYQFAAHQFSFFLLFQHKSK